MMRLNNIQLKTTMVKHNLLEHVKENRAKHAKIVEEAQKGYLAKAREALINRLKKIEDGAIVDLNFGSLEPPDDYLKIYDAVIHMLVTSIDDTITLQPDEFRQLVRDEWDWRGSFLLKNSAYSVTAAAMSE